MRLLAGSRGGWDAALLRAVTLSGMPDHRAHFDFEIRFANSGDLTGTGFRLDLPSPDLDEAAIGRLLVRHLGLALVDSVELRALRIVEEPHRGSRGVDSAPGIKVRQHRSSTSAIRFVPG